VTVAAAAAVAVVKATVEVTAWMTVGALVKSRVITPSQMKKLVSCGTDN
jgi:hypothetical protein